MNINVESNNKMALIFYDNIILLFPTYRALYHLHLALAIVVF